MKDRIWVPALSKEVFFRIEPAGSGQANLNLSMTPWSSRDCLGEYVDEVPKWIDLTNLEHAVENAVEWLAEADFLFLRVLKSSGRTSIPVWRPQHDGKRPSFSRSALVTPLFLAEIDESDLYDFQVKGVRWLLAADSRVLADDMGLGKTVQVIFALKNLVRLGQARSTLVLCPKGLVTNWMDELSKWAPELLSSFSPSLFGSDFRKEALRNHVLVANYEQLRSKSSDDAVCATNILVADEAHKLRNEESQLSAGFRSLARDRTWLLTGTPLERDLRDVATLLSLVDPLRFSSDDARMEPEMVRRLAAPYVLRRTKNQVLKELPSVLDATERLSFLPGQRKSYLRVISEKVTNSNALALLGRLRTICDLDPETKQSAKVDRTVEIIEKVAGEGEKLIVFSYLLEPLRVLERCLQKILGRGHAVIFEGSMNSADRAATIRRFSEEERPSVLLASTRVTGEGLTLTAANHVVFFNQWWNPSANDQARDRVVRIGQKKECIIYRLMMKDSVEEALERILRQKGLLMNEVVEGFADRRAEPQTPTPAVALEVLQESFSYVEEGRLGSGGST